VTELTYDAGAAGYDQMFARVTRLFIPPLVQAAALAPGHRVLDVATGTGAAALSCAEVVGPAGYVVGGDLSCAMLEKARRNLRSLPVALMALDWQALPFRDASFDALVCQLGLMFFPDPTRGVSEFRRVVREGGCVAVSVTSAAPERTLYFRVGFAIARHLPAKAQALRRLFALGDPRRLGALLEQAGLRETDVRSERRRIAFASFNSYFRHVASGAGTAGQAYLQLSPDAQRDVREEVWRGLLGSGSDRPFTIDMEVLIGSGRR
jgi:ubiquinone/menaquinone biosynthesis C-methylase UbiE